MKGALLTAAMLLGSASAGTHKMKLTKVPLSEQLVSLFLFITSIHYQEVWIVVIDEILMLCLQATANIDTHVQALGQKYMGIRPQQHESEMFKDTSLHAEKGSSHLVPVSNFMNAQCK